MLRQIKDNHVEADQRQPCGGKTQCGPDFGNLKDDHELTRGERFCVGLYKIPHGMFIPGCFVQSVVTEM
jgi:hypothetical protein